MQELEKPPPPPSPQKILPLKVLMPLLEGPNLGEEPGVVPRLEEVPPPLSLLERLCPVLQGLLQLQTP